jgi:hypothetical protein
MSLNQLVKLSVLSIPIIFFMSSCNSGGGSDGGGGSISCSDIAGGYYGTFTDNCSGNNASGEMLISLKSDCAFSGSSSFGVTNAGTFTARSGNAIAGAGTTDTRGCGKFSINCNENSGQINCGYTYSNGRGGKVNARLQ